MLNWILKAARNNKSQQYRYKLNIDIVGNFSTLIISVLASVLPALIRSICSCKLKVINGICRQDKQ